MLTFFLVVILVSFPILLLIFVLMLILLLVLVRMLISFFDIDPVPFPHPGVDLRHVAGLRPCLFLDPDDGPFLFISWC